MEELIEPIEMDLPATATEISVFANEYVQQHS